MAKTSFFKTNFIKPEQIVRPRDKSPLQTEFHRHNTKLYFNIESMILIINWISCNHHTIFLPFFCTHTTISWIFSQSDSLVAPLNPWKPLSKSTTKISLSSSLLQLTVGTVAQSETMHRIGNNRCVNFDIVPQFDKNKTWSTATDSRLLTHQYLIASKILDSLLIDSNLLSYWDTSLIHERTWDGSSFVLVCHKLMQKMADQEETICLAFVILHGLIDFIHYFRTLEQRIVELFP